jgi:SAM-dependent methyltransferase
MVPELLTLAADRKGFSICFRNGRGEWKVCGTRTERISRPVGTTIGHRTNLRNVEVLQGEAKTSGLPRASFDVVHARLVQVNLPEPQRVVLETLALARPGGVVANHEADWGAFLCDPPSPAWDRLLEALEALSRNNGIDFLETQHTRHF